MAGKLFNTKEEAAWTGLVKAQQAVLEQVERELKNRGFPPLVWYDVLLELDRMPDGRLRLAEIGDATLLQKFNVTRLVDRMEAGGLVRREACAEDGRGAYARITRKGRNCRKRMQPVYHAAVRAHFLRHFSDDEIARLATLLNRLTD